MYDLEVEKYGPSHCRTVSTLCVLCYVYFSKGDYANAITNLNLYIEVAKKLYGANHSDVIDASKMLEACKKLLELNTKR